MTIFVALTKNIFVASMQHLDLELHLNTRKGSDERRLIEKCIKNDRSAQRQLYEMLAPKMFPLCIRYMGDRDKAEDVLQDGFITLFSKLGSYSGEGSFEGWARKVFVNTALMSLRKNDVLKESEEIDAAWGISSDEPGVIDKMGYDELMKIISGLPSGFRTVFNMYVIEGYSHKEIGEALGITENTSRSQLMRARGLIQAKIKALK